MVTIIESHAPQTVEAKRTWGHTSKMRGFTLHETANTAPGADAEAHDALQDRGGMPTSSWNVSVDDDSAVETYPDDVRTWHAGVGQAGDGDDTIAIEVCVNADGDYVQAWKNAADVVRQKRATNPRIGPLLVDHHHWSGKDCPHFLRAGRDGVTWPLFLSWVEHGTGATPVSNVTPTAPAAFDGTALQRIVEAVPDNVNGPDTRRRINAVRKASRWGGGKFPDGVAYTQAIVDTETDGVWGPKSRAAHDRIVAEIQKVVGAGVDGVWGPKTEAAVQAYLSKMRTV